MMKRIFTVILSLALILSLAGCKETVIDGGEEHTFVVPPKACAMFGGTPEVVVENKDYSPWMAGNYVSMEVDAEGNLVIVLNDRHIEHWKSEALDMFETAREGDKKDGLGKSFEVNKDYTELSYYSNRDLLGGAIIKAGILFPYCGIMQMLNGEDISNWYVDIKVIDIDTGIVVKESRLPQDGSLNISYDEWDAAVGAAE